MAGDKYVFHGQNDYYFITNTVVYWVDIFTRKEYKDIIVDSLNYCVKEKGLELNAWVLMTNHLHMVCRAKEPFRISDIMRDFKKFTSKAITSAMEEIPESRKEWILDKLAFEARRSGRTEYYKVWKDDYHAILIDGKISIMQKINYLHDNPVRAGIVFEPDEYVYSSAIDYAGKKGLVKVDVL